MQATFENDLILQHLIRYQNEPDVAVHSLACEKNCTLKEAYKMIKRKANNYLSKKDLYRYFDGNAEVEEWLNANAESRKRDAQAAVSQMFPISASLTCEKIQEFLGRIEGEIQLSITRQTGKRGERLYNEILERELNAKKVELQNARRVIKCLEQSSAEMEAQDTALIAQLGAQTDLMKRGESGSNSFIYLIIGIGIVGLAVVAAFSAKK
jgi:hypothetical protein